MKRKFPLLSILIIILIVILSVYQNKKFVAIANNEIKENNLISMMIEQKDGTYKESTEKDFPKEGYIFNDKKSGCENGGTLTWNVYMQKVEASLLTSDKCYAYFDLEDEKTFTLIADGIINKDKTITNILDTAGNFENSSDWNTNCIINNDLYMYGNYSCKINAPDSVVEKCSFAINKLNVIANHNYYIQIYMLSDFNAEIDVHLLVSGVGFGFNGIYMGKNIPMQWSKVSTISESPTTTSANIRIDNNNEYKESTVYYDGLMVVDLTADYGEAYPTKEWLDKNLIYFDGTKDIKTVVGSEGTFNISNSLEDFYCSIGGSATISDGKVIIKGTEENTTCVLV